MNYINDIPFLLRGSWPCHFNTMFPASVLYRLRKVIVENAAF